MSDNWNLIKQEVGTYRTYVNNLSPAAAAEAKFCFLLTKEEIDRLLALKGDDSTLAGVRIYLGGKQFGNNFVPTVHVVAVEKTGEAFNDYNVPTEMPAPAEDPMMFGAAAPGSSSVGDLPPCPNICSGTNILNS